MWECSKTEVALRLPIPAYPGQQAGGIPMFPSRFWPSNIITTFVQQLKEFFCAGGYAEPVLHASQAERKGPWRTPEGMVDGIVIGTHRVCQGYGLRTWVLIIDEEQPSLALPYEKEKSST